MSDWKMSKVAAALPELAPASEPPVPQQTDSPVKNPQEHGWVAKTNYDYNTYNKTTKELSEESAAVSAGGGDDAIMGVQTGQWASSAAVYEWIDEYGDVGPRHEDLEKQLFGGDFNMRSGIKFDNIATLEVTQEGSIRISPVRRFDDAGLHPVMMQNVKLAGYDSPTPIQQYCLPAVFKGHDIVACAQTGSGKTAAFLIPILSKLMGKAKKLAAPRPNPATYISGITPPVRAEPLVLIICPTRELATQIFNEARKFCYRSMLRPAVIYGGGPIAEQIATLEKGCDVLIGTPGRLIDFISRPQILTLRRLKYIVIDEADEMLHSDWEQDLKQILEGGDQEEGNINYLMFSATFPKQCRDLAKEHLAYDHVRIRVGRAGSSHMNIKQDIVWVESHVKRKALEDLLLSTPPARTIIFVNSKRSADELDDFLFNKGFPCVSIHADRTQREREDCIRAFRSGKMPILIATGVSARGLDIHNVMHVINYDMPSAQYGGIEEYTHRIGRTGRIGNMGLATSFYNDRDSDLGETLTKTLLETHQVVPDFLEQYIPEGFTADGAGDINQLKFDADSDEEDENAAESGEGNAGGAPASGWGTEPAVGGWGATAAPATPSATGWTAPASSPAEPASVPINSWGGAATTVAPATQASGWGAPAPPPTQSASGAKNSWGGTPASQASGWGTPAAPARNAPVAETKWTATSNGGW